MIIIKLKNKFILVQTKKMNWKQKFDLVISDFKQFEHLKSDAYYFTIQNTIQIFEVPYSETVIVPPVCYMYKLGESYVYQSSSLMFVYKFLKKQTSYQLFPDIVVYDYLCLYYDIVESVRDRYEAYEYYHGEILVFHEFKKWLDNDTTFLITMNNSYKRICKNISDNYISEYNSNILECYNLIKHRLPRYNNILKYLLI